MSPETLRAQNMNRHLQAAELAGGVAITGLDNVLRLSAAEQVAARVRANFDRLWQTFRGDDYHRLVVLVANDEDGAAYRVELTRGGQAIGYVEENGESTELEALTLGSARMMEDKALVRSVLRDEAISDVESWNRAVGSEFNPTFPALLEERYVKGLERWAMNADETMTTVWRAARNPELNPSLAAKFAEAQATTAV